MGAVAGPVLPPSLGYATGPLRNACVHTFCVLHEIIYVFVQTFFFFHSSYSFLASYHTTANRI